MITKRIRYLLPRWSEQAPLQHNKWCLLQDVLTAVIVFRILVNNKILQCVENQGVLMRF